MVQHGQKAERVSASLIRVDGDHAYAPMSQAVGLPLVIEAARESGVAILALTRTIIMAALWPEVEALAEAGLAGFACVSYMPMVAPAGAKKPCSAPIPSPLPGRARANHRSATIWRRQPWPWVKFRLPHVKAMLSPQVQGLIKTAR